jgi:predicted deacylase
MAFQIEDIIVNPGEVKRGHINVGEASTHIVKLPYIIINGVKKGARLTILSGVHSLECAPVEAVYRLSENIKPENLAGTLILVPIVNTEGFHSRTPYNNQLDHLNQNKVFPGDPEASITQKVAYIVFEKFVSKSDALIDAHSADLGEDVKRGIFIYKTEDKELYDKMVTLASLYNPAFIESINISGNTGEAVIKYHIPCVMIESGAPYPIREEDIKYHYDGAINVMKHLSMLNGGAKSYDVLVDPPRQRIWAKKGGVWRRKIEAGQIVEKNMVLGTICNLIGETQQVILAPFDGVVSFLRVHYSVNSGDTLLWIAKTKPYPVYSL